MFHFFMSSHIETSVRSIVAIMTLKHFLLTYIQSSFIYLSYLLPPLSAICLQISRYKRIQDLIAHTHAHEHEHEHEQKPEQ